jgi:protein-tyrosine phosphatase
MAAALAMCKCAVDDGISTIVATPHKGARGYDPSAAEIRSSVKRLNEAIAEKRYPLVVLPGAEYAVDSDSLGGGEELVSVNFNGKYLLLELPHSYVPSYFKEILFRLQLRGIKPILAHPERHPFFQQNPENLVEFVRAGALLQVTGASILGLFGRTAQLTTERLFAYNIVHIIATDAHSANRRAPLLTEAVEKAAAITGSMERARKCVVDVPRMVLDGQAYEQPIADPSLTTRPFPRKSVVEVLRKLFFYKL